MREAAPYNEPAVNKAVSAKEMQFPMADRQNRLQRIARDLREKEEISRGLIEATTRQQNMLPDPPEIKGFDFATVYKPATNLSGDFYDFFMTKENNVGIVVGDVSGHGVEAGIVMGMAKTTVNIYGRMVENPVEVLKRANADLHSVLDGKTFVSLSYAVIDRKTRELTFARAGHNPPILYNPKWKTGESKRLMPPGLALGVVKGNHFDRVIKEHKEVLEEGDCFIQYTDGVVEAPNAQKQQFGEDRLNDLIRKYGRTKMRELVAIVSQALAEHHPARLVQPG